VAWITTRIERLRLGLRAGEVAKLQLDDMDWRAGGIVVADSKGNRTERIPLPADVGEAVAAYLRRGRPVNAQECSYQYRGERDRCARGKEVRPRADSCASTAPHGGNPYVARRCISAGDWATSASPQHHYHGDLCQSRSCRFAIDCSPVAGRRRVNALRKALADYFAVRLNRYGPCESKMLLINRHRDYP
jgi:hypothetical protein